MSEENTGLHTSTSQLQLNEADQLSTNIRIEIWLVRHGETDWNALGRIQGHIDVELNELGLQQAQKVANGIATHYPKATLNQKYHTTIYSSDLKRAATTADYIHQQLVNISGDQSFNIVKDVRLRELNFGEKLSGTSYKSHTTHFFNSSNPEKKIGGDDNPNAESHVDLQNRFNACIEDICLKFAKSGKEGASVIVVCHGGCIRTQICKWLGLPLKTMRMFQVYNTSIHRFAIHVNRNAAVQSNRIRIVKKEVIELNNTAHLNDNRFLDSE